MTPSRGPFRLAPGSPAWNFGSLEAGALEHGRKPSQCEHHTIPPRRWIKGPGLWRRWRGSWNRAGRNVGGHAAGRNRKPASDVMAKPGIGGMSHRQKSMPSSSDGGAIESSSVIERLGQALAALQIGDAAAALAGVSRIDFARSDCRESRLCQQVGYGTLGRAGQEPETSAR